MDKMKTKGVMNAASEDYLKLVEYVKTKPEGYLLYYLTVETDTGIKMDYAGRSKLRRAIEKCGYEAENHNNKGYVLAEVANAVIISDIDARRILNKLMRSEKRNKRLIDRFLTRLPPDQRDRILLRESALGGMIGSRSLFTGRKPVYKITEAKPELPTGI